MRNLLNALVLILLTVFYCFGSNFNSNAAEFYKITQSSKPYDGLHFMQSVNDQNFSFITKNKNINPVITKHKVFASKKNLNYIHKTILTGITFSGLTKGKYFITDQYSFQLPSHVLLMIIPFHWFT
jgi:CTP-dependent riboflavin kinase